MNEKNADRFYERLTIGIDQANSMVCEELNQYCPHCLLHLGDTTGGWQERGIFGSLAIDLAKYRVQTWRQLCPEILFCAGGHDTGYSHRGSLPGGGINAESVQNCQQIFGDLWWLKQCEGVHLLGICSPLAKYHGDDGTLEALRDLQQRFLSDAKFKIKNDPWILFAHDPFLPPIVSQLLRYQLPNCRGFVHGHLHNPGYTKLIRAIGAIMDNPLLRISHTCPSVAPLSWQGCGMTKIAIDDTKVSISDHLLDVPEEIASLPTASFFRCLWWKL